MDNELKEIHRELEDELIYLFDKIVTEDSEQLGKEDQYHVRYRTTSEVYNRRETGTVIIGSEDSDQITYAYRLIFNTSENKPSRKYWYSDNFGLKNISVILGEKEHIIDGVLRNCCRRTDVISQDEIDYIEELFEELERRRSTLREFYDTEDISDFLLSNDRKMLQDVIAPDKESSVELWKLLFSRNSEGAVVENDIDIKLRTDNLVLARTKRQYNGSGGLREYPFGLVIGRDEWNDSFYFHRLKRNEMLDDPEHDWSHNDLRDSLGYDVCLATEDPVNIKSDCRTRLCPNLITVALDYDKQLQDYRNHVYDSLRSMVRYLYLNLYTKNRRYNISGLKANLTRRDGLSIDKDSTTKEIKNIQDELGIDEEDVRSLQSKRDIGRLSSNLRSEIAEVIFDQMVLDWIFEQPSETIRNYQVEYEEQNQSAFGNYIPSNVISVSSQMIDQTISDPGAMDSRSIYNLSCKVSENKFTENLRSLKFEENNHRFEFKNSKRHPRHIGVNGYDIDKVDKIIIPQSSEVLHEHSDGKSVSISVEKGVYTLRNMRSTRTQHF